MAIETIRVAQQGLRAGNYVRDNGKWYKVRGRVEQGPRWPVLPVTDPKGFGGHITLFDDKPFEVAAQGQIPGPFQAAKLRRDAARTRARIVELQMLAQQQELLARLQADEQQLIDLARKQAQ